MSCESGVCKKNDEWSTLLLLVPCSQVVRDSRFAHPMCYMAHCDSGVCKKSLYVLYFDYACHPCAGTMLIFSLRIGNSKSTNNDVRYFRNHCRRACAQLGDLRILKLGLVGESGEGKEDSISRQESNLRTHNMFAARLTVCLMSGPSGRTWPSHKCRSWVYRVCTEWNLLRYFLAC